ncbi:MAG TPA: hypothetical protein VGC91_19730 [Pyrinomonadaceae bacterium]
MSRKIHASLLALLMLTAFALAGGKAASTAAASPAASSDLLSALPPSDFIFYVDSQRVLNDVIPTIFADQPEARARLESDLDQAQKELGFDPRTIEATATGFNFPASRQSRGYDFAIILRGRFDANAIIDGGFANAIKRSKGELEKRTRQYEGRTIYVLAQTARPATEGGKSEEVEREPSGNTMVFVALDSNTVALGNLKSVQATIDASMGRAKVDDELVQLAMRSPGAVVSFSGNVTQELANSFHIGNKEANNSLSSIRQIYGSFNLSGSDGEAFVNLRTETAEQASHLGTIMNGLKLMARLGRARNADEQKSLETLINTLNIYAVGNEVQINLKVTAKDLLPIVRTF